MREYDLIVIGSGLAGLTAAAAAASQGKSVLVMTKGAGTIAIGGGSIDVLGYGAEGRPAASPAAGLEKLPAGHPYSKIGRQRVEAAMGFFLDLTATEGYPYSGSLDQMRWLPTVLGTLKPSCLVPKTMTPIKLSDTENIVVMGFSGLKDFYPELVVRGLGRRPAYHSRCTAAVLETGFGEGRDISALDIARWLDSESGRQECAEKVRKVIAPGSVIVLPPVLGTRADYQTAKQLEQETGCRFIEVAGLPPAVTGLRLRNMLVSHLKKRGVALMEQANVAGAVIQSGRCRAVITKNIDRQREYSAKAFVLATGGFLGGGLVSEAGSVREAIFDLPVKAPSNQEEWGNKSLFSAAGQPFARLGIEVDARLRPVDQDGTPLLDNVRIAGCSLAGYDHCVEKSGNGVAVASGYQAGISL